MTVLVDHLVVLTRIVSVDGDGDGDDIGKKNWPAIVVSTQAAPVNV